MTKIQRLVIYALTFVVAFATVTIWYFTPNEQATLNLLSKAEITFPELKKATINEAILIAETRIRQSHPRLRLFRIFHIIDPKDAEDFNRHLVSLGSLPEEIDKAMSNSINLPEITCPAKEWLWHVSERSYCQFWPDAGCVNLVHQTSKNFGAHPPLGWFKRYILTLPSEQ